VSSILPTVRKTRDHYARYTPWSMIVLLWRALWAPSAPRRQAFLNRYNDYAKLADSPKHMALHQRLHQQLFEAADNWPSYDYGQGYFYQGLEALGITGLRDTDARLEQMNLEERVAGKSVLEIGCNAGFIAVSIAKAAERVTAFDLNPYLVEMGRLAGEHLERQNIEFLVSSFEDLAPTQFDVVLSFANHHTYDQNTKQSIGEYLASCDQFLSPGGLFLFESHPPGYEDAEQVEQVCALIEGMFHVEERRVLEKGTYLDRGRTFVVATKTGGADPTTG
jgi:cyclopropane fatty-acyl-phospholipid synthase-like methyltransferase